MGHERPAMPGLTHAATIRDAIASGIVAMPHRPKSSPIGLMTLPGMAHRPIVSDRRRKRALNEGMDVVAVIMTEIPMLAEVRSTILVRRSVAPNQRSVPAPTAKDRTQIRSEQNAKAGNPLAALRILCSPRLPYGRESRPTGPRSEVHRVKPTPTPPRLAGRAPEQPMTGRMTEVRQRAPRAHSVP